VLERLAASADWPARALTMLGRIVKTIYILRYLQDAAIRDRVQLQLNRGESRHELARRLFFANQGAFRTGDYEEIFVPAPSDVQSRIMIERQNTSARSSTANTSRWSVLRYGSGRGCDEVMGQRLRAVSLPLAPGH
jgi:hypothetical protein